MPTVNVEMMKQLLHEFTEKEALTGEEIKAIEQQVAELNERIGVCHNKLKNLNEDRERLAAMMGRYVGGKVAAPSNIGMINEPQRPRSLASTPAKSLSVQPPAKTENKTTDIADKEEQSGQSVAPQKADSSAQQELVAASNKDKEEKVEVMDLSESKAADKDKPAESGGGDDAIKSINEALKGLFRK